MKRVLFSFYKSIAFLSRLFRSRNVYMFFIEKAHVSQGVVFIGKPRYIQLDAFLDPLGGLSLGEGVVISTKVIVLTHDYSYTVALAAIGKRPQTDVAIFKPVVIGQNVFIGAGAILLPGTEIGRNCIVGSGAVVKGVIPDNSIVVGNPCRVIRNTADLAHSFYDRFEDEVIHHDKN